MALPKGYKVPESKKSSDLYMKLLEGANKFRILSPITTGYEWWVEEDTARKPYRVETFNEVPTELWTGSEDRPKHFWAMAVWNYATKTVQVLELTQKSLQKALESFEKNQDWGDLMKYDITITKTGKGRETNYAVTPSPAKPLAADIVKKYKGLTIDLTALFRSENPFQTADEAADLDVENLTLDDLVTGIA